MRRKGTDQKRRLPSEPAAVIAGSVMRREWILVSVVLVVGIGLRIAALSRSAVEHFDEGVYASNIYFGGPEYAYPLQRFYAPPLLPALIEAGMIVGLPPNLAALLPSFLAGCATIVALWWFGRSWFGAEVGIAAATLGALSDFHVTYSAAALTDVLLGLWLVLAVDAIGRSLGHKRSDGTRSVPTYDFRWAALAGVYTGLAWWTKYNGWLPLAIEAAALPFLWIVVRPARRELLRWLACFAITAVVAGLIWTPCYFSLQAQGGYGPIAANHAKYVVGITGWLDSARRQAAAMATLEWPLDRIAVFLAPAAALLASSGKKSGRWAQLSFAIALALVPFFIGSTVLLALVGALRIFGWAIGLNPAAANDSARRRGAFGTVLLAVWFGALFVATPLYTPYPRLLLPWLIATWLGAARAADWLLNVQGLHEKLIGTRWRRLAFLGAWAALGIMVALISPRRPMLSLSRDRTGLARVAAETRNGIGPESANAIYVFGEPAMFFQLRASGEEHVAPVQALPREAATIDGQPIPTFLVVGPHAERDPQFKEQWEAAEDRWELIKEFEYKPSAVVWLDLHDPRQPPETSNRHRVRQYRLRQ